MTGERSSLGGVTNEGEGSALGWDKEREGPEMDGERTDEWESAGLVEEVPLV